MTRCWTITSANFAAADQPTTRWAAHKCVLDGAELRHSGILACVTTEESLGRITRDVLFCAGADFSLKWLPLGTRPSAQQLQIPFTAFPRPPVDASAATVIDPSVRQHEGLSSTNALRRHCTTPFDQLGSVGDSLAFLVVNRARAGSPQEKLYEAIREAEKGSLNDDTEGRP